MSDSENDFADPGAGPSKVFSITGKTFYGRSRRNPLQGCSSSPVDSDDSVVDPDYVAPNTNSDSDSDGNMSELESMEPPVMAPQPVEEGVGAGVAQVETPRRGKVVKKGRKRVARPDAWGQAIAKQKRNAGEAYTSYGTKKKMPARKIGPMCNDGCFEDIGLDKVKELFEAFWKIGNYDLQNLYLQSLIRPYLLGVQQIPTSTELR